MSSATTKSRECRVEVVCDFLEWSCATFNIQVALEDSGYAVQIRGGESGRTRCCVVSSLQHLVTFEVLNIVEDKLTC